MSKYYTIQTSNAFGALDLESDGEEVVLSTPPKAPVVETPVAPVEVKKDNRSPRRNQGKRDPREPRADRPKREPRVEKVATEGTSEVVEGEEGDTRRADRKGDRPPRRGNRDYQAKDGKRTFDRRGGAAKPKEDTDAVHHLEDEKTTGDASPTDAAVVVSEPVAPAVPEEVRLGVSDWLKEKELTRITKEAGEVPTDVIDQISKEIVDSGYKAFVEPEVKIYGPTASKAQKKKVAEKSVPLDLFALTGKVAPLKQKGGDDRRNNNRDGGDRRNNRNNRDNRDTRTEKNGSETPEKLKKKLYKDETVFPALE